MWINIPTWVIALIITNGIAWFLLEELKPSGGYESWSPTVSRIIFCYSAFWAGVILGKVFKI